MAQKADAQAGSGLFYRLRQAFKAEKGSNETPLATKKAVQALVHTDAGDERPERSERDERLLVLTRRERELLLLLLDGYTLKESAGALSVQYSTANTHMTSLYKKLGVTSRPELIIQYRELCIQKDRK